MPPTTTPVTVIVEDNQALEQEAKAFRRSRTPLLLAVAANVVLSALCLGVPYYRGRIHAQESLAAFADFSACLFSGKVAPRPGLSLPRGERPRFAKLVLSQRQDWPAACDKSLSRIAPPEATFLWPSVKRTGSDVRKVVIMLKKELATLADAAKRLHAIPERPLLVVAKLRATLALFAEAAGSKANLDRDAIVLANSGVQEEPTRLPLMAGESAPTHLWSAENVIFAMAADQRGVSLLRLAAGSVERARPRRTGLVRGTLVADNTPYVVWATRESRCAELDDHCEGRAIGVRAMEMNDTSLPEPHWYAGHPYSRIDRSIQIAGDQLRLLTRTNSPQAVELRLFSMAAPIDPKVPTAASEAKRFDSETAIADALLLPGPSPAVLLLSKTESGLRPELRGMEPAQPTLAPITGDGAWAKACSHDQRQFVAYGTELAIEVLAIHANAVSVSASPVATVLGDVYDEQDPQQDAVAVSCGDDAAAVVYRDRKRRLWNLRCGYDAQCDSPQIVATEVTYSASTMVSTNLVIAHSNGDFGQIEVSVNGKTSVNPGPCFTPRSGLCGEPILFSDGSHLVLAAHDASDLLTMESTDFGISFHPLPGLAKVGQGASDVRVLEQHRMRKGIN